MQVNRLQWLRISAALVILAVLFISSESQGYSYTITDTDQSLFYDSVNTISAPSAEEPFFGQDAQYNGITPSYNNNDDGTVTDINTGLMWQQGVSEKMTWEEAMTEAETCTIGGYTDWRVPTIKELYSLILFSGTDPSGPNPVNLIPFIDTDYFEFEYGDTLAGDRLIDAQYWSSTQYAGLTMNSDSTTFGVNFADGRIKGYPNEPVGPPGQQFYMTSFVRYVRGNNYGENQFIDNNDGTVTDFSTGLMWQQSDDGIGRNWQEALDYAENLSQSGHDDWRLPNTHELQSLLDYTRSLQETNSPAINSIFNCTQITDEGGSTNYGFYWTGTTHANANATNTGGYAAYIAFGEALGWMMTPDSTNILMDVHGAGAQRSDPKVGDPGQYPHGHGPQGDVIRIYNLVRCVRNADPTGISETTANLPSIQISGTNPFSNTLTLTCIIPFSGSVQLSVYDSSGRIIDTLVNSTLNANIYSYTWYPANQGISTGIYLFKLSTESGNSVIKAVFSSS